MTDTQPDDAGHVFVGGHTGVGRSFAHRSVGGQSERESTHPETLAENEHEYDTDTHSYTHTHTPTSGSGTEEDTHER